ncbi:sushi, nidogen and EGF-like domain-containing protein 1 isoform X1 [Erpetoichthys calabaricus]|uniref:sushi, nidogen and EGF-like domain-containing protein 1 isoform X1 n=2 Tax=Erpetoichthys calabaricus TaxID=27687 RepID=UPI00109FD447|nr:sushi, nidogen and EGF-like domain-containing protein 1 isoform X1 [Erpetoichthys calabaricus]
MRLGVTLLWLWTAFSPLEGVVPLEDFYPFGIEHGDSRTVKQDDGGSGLLEISVNFPFFGDRHSGLYVNNNGLVSFLREVSQFTPVAFPIAGDRRVVAPFWADVDNRRAGEVFYRESKDPAILQRTADDIHQYFPEFPMFTATWALIATWYRVTFFGGSSFSPVNTFQAVLVTNGNVSFTIFQYEHITWTTGMHTSSGGDFAGLGGTAAQAGFNAGDGTRYFNIPGSRTEDIVDVEETTNVGVPGRWVFRIDDAHVQMGGCNDSASVCQNLRPCMNGGHCIDDCITGNPSYTCSCPSGYTGKKCQLDINECESSPCMNGGTCIEGVGNFTCLCEPGYTGPMCETDVNECECNPCKNGGTCVEGAGNFSCLCNPGYKGLTCETDVDECESSPCVNEGTCIDGVNHFTCVCKVGYTGLTCETEEKDSCSQKQCQNEGSCLEVNGTTTCVCILGFTGEYCEEERCPCQNGGFCIDGNSTCDCPSGFTGDVCELEVTQTACSLSIPCPGGGPCMEYGGSYLCTCQTGMIEAEIQPSACDSAPCLHGGVCLERDSGYICECNLGYRGKNCEQVKLSVCASNPCRNGGSCRGDGDGYHCLCPYRFHGKHCEIGKPDPCSSSPCINGGTCFHYIGKYKCECTADFTGRHCENGLDACLSNPCKHGGNCTADTDGAYQCHCKFGFRGTHCETEISCGPPSRVKNSQVQYSSTHPGSSAIYVCHSGYTLVPESTISVCGIHSSWSQPPICEEINECLSEPCLNGGTCKDRVAAYICTCENGFTGPNCETELDECLSEPCKHGGICLDQPGAYFCQCPEGFVGQDCEAEEDTCLLQPCGSRGYCRSESRGRYSCTCKVGHTGKDCEKELFAPAALQVKKLEEDEVEVSWKSANASQKLIDGFAVTYTPVGGGARKTDFLDKHRTTHLLRSLLPGRLYNVSVYSVKRNTNNNDISQSVVTLVRTRPHKVEEFLVTNVSTSRVWMKWVLRQSKHSIADGFQISLKSAKSTEETSVLLNSSIKEHSIGSLVPGQMYTVDIVTQSGLKPEQLPTVSQSAGPIRLWTRPLPPQNFSMAFITMTTAQVTWNQPHTGFLDGYVINITFGHTTKSRYLPNRRMTSYTVRDLSPMQQYRLALTAVINTDHEQLHSAPMYLNFTTMQSDESTRRREATETRREPQTVKHRAPSTQPLPAIQLQPVVTANRENSEEVPRYTELIDGRQRITAKFGNIQKKAIVHRPRPEPPIKLDMVEETTNKVGLALQAPEEEKQTNTEEQSDCKTNPCRNGGTCVKEPDSYSCDCSIGYKGKHCELFCQRVPHPCTRLYSETKTIQVWKRNVCHYQYKRTYKVHQDVCYREICEPVITKKSPRDRRTNRHK